MEKIKLGSIECDLVPNGVQLSGEGGRLVFQPGENSFEVIEVAVKAVEDLVVLDDAGNPILTRSDLVYAGRLAKDDNYVIGTEQIQAGTDPETGEAVMETQDVVGTVMIAEFRVPDIREQLAETQAKLEYVAMMAGIETEV